MKVEIYNRYWEYITTINDVVKVEDKAYGFRVVIKGGFSKEYGRECDYTILEQGERR